MKLISNTQKRNISGGRIRQARHEKKMTQQELSIKLEFNSVYIDRASISKIEQHKRIVTDYEIVAFSKVLSTSVNWLLGLDK